MTTDDDKPGQPDQPAEGIPEPEPTRLRLEAQGAIQRLTGRRYQIDLKRLDARSLQELLRFVRDASDAKESAVRKARLTPWRR